MSSQQDALKTGRADSLGRRPAIANAATPVAGSSKVNREYDGRRTMSKGSMIRVERIRSDPGQPRKTFGTEADERLAASMERRGQLVPILVRWDATADRYVVIDGDRRFRAAQQAGLGELACVVEQEADSDEILELQLITNALREDVLPVEQAKAWDRLMMSRNLTHRELAAKLGYDHSTVTKALDLLKLTPEIQGQVDAGEIPASTAGQIARLDDPAEQTALAARVVAEKLSRAEVAGAVAEKSPVRSGKSSRTFQGKSGMMKGSTTRTFKGQGGLVLTATRAKGLDLLALVEALRAFADQVEANNPG